MSNMPPPIYPLLRVRRAFDRRAPRFSGAAFLLREIAGRMHQRLDYIRLEPAVVADVGCAVGGGFAALRARYPLAHLVGIDLSLAMLQQADAVAGLPGWLPRLVRQQRWWIGRDGSRANLIQADMSVLPMRSGSVDLLWSNLALHWMSTPHLVFPEWRRVLSSNGLVMFSVFGPDTLKEMRSALGEIDSERHIPDFVDMHDIGDMLVDSRLSTPVMDMETLTVTYQTVDALLRDVRLLGFYPAVPETRGLKGRNWRSRLQSALDSRRNADGQVPLTFEIVYGHAWNGAPPGKSTAHGEMESIIRVDDLRRRRQNRV